ncbi:hypothetical protein [Gordonia sp. OPL2]|uniref:hypothetical protein n=1 Tax=Gordonia sp. OPL2 TaxID=2486274 RepID=UPI0016550C2B|nr:hypothetical protein [Gordonia sp. OPL2]ROZ89468.1 hypothetical protein EEB19_17565 [Gordonia sp. OPL2]
MGLIRQVRDGIMRFAQRNVVARRRGDVVDTYRNLRIGMVTLILMLAFAVTAESIRSTDIRPSISDYYDTSVRAVFIATVCAMGAMLMAYKGRSEIEDVLLNYAGFLAFFVAFLPTDTAERLVYPPRDWIILNMWTAVFGGVSAVVIWSLISRIGRFATSRRTTLAGNVARGLGLCAVIVVVAKQLWWEDAFGITPHVAAAVSMFGFLTLVVGVNGLAAVVRDAPRRYATAYFLIATGMFVTVVVAGVASVCGWGEGVNLVFWVEWVLLAAFLAFWLVQTAELWDEEAELKSAVDGDARARVLGGDVPDADSPDDREQRG